MLPRIKHVILEENPEFNAEIARSDMRKEHSESAVNLSGAATAADRPKTKRLQQRADIWKLPSHVVPPTQRTTIYRFAHDFRIKFGVFLQISVFNAISQLFWKVNSSSIQYRGISAMEVHGSTKISRDLKVTINFFLNER